MESEKLLAGPKTDMLMPAAEAASNKQRRKAKRQMLLKQASTNRSRLSTSLAPSERSLCIAENLEASV